MDTQHRNYVFCLQLTLVLLFLFLSHSLYAATLTQTQFLGLSNVTTSDRTPDRDISCTTNSNIQGCSIIDVRAAAQASTSGPTFQEFDPSLGTLNSVNLSYNLETGGVWISRPEDSQFSISTDFSYSNTLSLEWIFLNSTPSNMLIEEKSTSGNFNYRVNQATDNWVLNFNNSMNFDPAAFQGTGISTISVAYLMFASLLGQGLDCAATSACGTTNRITFLSSTSFTLTYGYTPDMTVVPLPASMILLASGFFGLIGFRKKLRLTKA